jgi:16S rRNA (cytidine1402-2'-O)-methyltransferase
MYSFSPTGRNTSDVLISSAKKNTSDVLISIDKKIQAMCSFSSAKKNRSDVLILASGKEHKRCVFFHRRGGTGPMYCFLPAGRNTSDVLNFISEKEHFRCINFHRQKKYKRCVLFHQRERIGLMYQFSSAITKYIFMTSMISIPQLYIVATPIGNLGDMTFRAVETLQTVDIVAAENTNTAKKLFSKFDIHTPLTSFHAYSTERVVDKIIQKIKSGKSVALISEAGTPGISDPGFSLVRKALEEGIKITPIPGCCAAITALCASGLPTDKFVYLGFLPRKKGRRKLLESLCEEKRTIIFYESPHRIQKTICELETIFGKDCSVVLARELTKLYEEFFRGSLAEAVEFLKVKKVRGEFTVLLKI